MERIDIDMNLAGAAAEGTSGTGGAAALLTLQRRAFAADPAPARAVRIDRLQRLLRLVEDHEAEFIAAIDADFGGRSAHETRLAEVLVLRAAVRHARRHLRRWMGPLPVPTDGPFRPGRNQLLPQPLGVVGVVAPWNYPLQLALAPAVGALAAGNRVMVKPSEHTPRLAEVLQRRVAQAFDPAELAVVTGGVDVARDFVSLPFDHLVFTGSTPVGRQVALAAAANLTPVTLEMGGKSPAIIDASCNLKRAAARIAFGKLLNAGQTCIAPDYLLVPEGWSAKVALEVGNAMARLYPSLLRNPDYTAIIDRRHRDRLIDMQAQARALGAQVLVVNPAGERFDGDTRKLPPAIVVGATRSMRMMREEIFGPLLPIVEYRDVDDAIAQVNAGDPPLALYWFGRDRRRRAQVLSRTRAGGVTVNDCLWHIAQEHQPFGGVGASGMGAYHGEWGFRRFSHMKPVFHQARWNGGFLLRPPYGRAFEALVAVLRRWL